MRKSRFSAEQAAHAVAQVEAGVPLEEVCRKMGVSARRACQATGFHRGSLRYQSRKPEQAEEHHYLHQGIAARNFERRFQLAEHIEVKGARLNNGLLHIELEREIPEAMKPKQIPIGNGSATLIDAEDRDAA